MSVYSKADPQDSPYPPCPQTSPSSQKPGVWSNEQGEISREVKGFRNLSLLHSWVYLTGSLRGPELGSALASQPGCTGPHTCHGE